MSSWRRRARVALLALVAGLASVPAVQAQAQAQAQAWPGIGRAATASELAAWDIDVRPDFRGLPPGAGSVARGQRVWDERCAACHGSFGESNTHFTPIVGGTSAADIARGRVARLADPAYPARTTLMRLATVSTLWDYVRRAMPWQEPKSLAVDDVYAVTAYLLALGGIVGDDFVLDERSIAGVQARLPNRDGMTVDHALWPGGRSAARRPDVQGSRCRRDCRRAPAIAAHASDAAWALHGNPAEQNRPVGGVRGLDARGRVGPDAAPVSKY